MICKINNQIEFHNLECKILDALNKEKYSYFPEIKKYGIHKEKPFIIMERLGNDLDFYQKRHNSKFDYKTVNQIGIQIIKILEQFHSIGYVYNDLKPENICVGQYGDEASLNQLRLIDFGLASPFLIQNQHVEKTYGKDFQGNIAFSSKNAFELKIMSRRDDLISLVYMLFFLKNGKLPFFDYKSDVPFSK